jgi:DNA-directed RNA polymerase specialized sigma subunit
MAPPPTPPTPAPIVLPLEQDNSAKENELKKKKNEILYFIDQFEHTKKRSPSNDEIIANLEGSISVDIIESILNDLSISKDTSFDDSPV